MWWSSSSGAFFSRGDGTGNRSGVSPIRRIAGGAIVNSFTARRRVEFCDTDMAGMMHFANFFRFMEYAEQELLRSRGLSVAWMTGEEKLGFPRVSASCDYLKPARFEQVLDIVVTVERVGQKSITYGFEFRHDGAVIAIGRTSAVCCRVGASG